MQEDKIKKDINEVKNDLSNLKSSFNKLINLLKNTIPEAKEIMLVSGNENLLSSADNKQYVSVFNTSIIKSTHIQKLISECDVYICKYKEQNLFTEFCYYIAGLIEESNKYFLRKKFRELQNGENTDLLEAYSLLESDISKPWEMPNIRISRDEVTRLRQQYRDNEDNYYLDCDQYISLNKLENTKSQFLLEICFVMLFKHQFYEQKNKFSYRVYIDKTKQSKQKVSVAIQRQPKKTINSITPLNIEFYVRLDNTRRFRNIYEHNKNDKNKRTEELKKLKEYVKVDEDNYNGIIEAAQWLLVQLG